MTDYTAPRTTSLNSAELDRALAEDAPGTIVELPIAGAWAFIPQVFGDDRGGFHEWFRAEQFTEQLGYPLQVVAPRRHVTDAVHPCGRGAAGRVTGGEDGSERGKARGRALGDVGRHVAVADLYEQPVDARRCQLGQRQRRPGEVEQ